MKREGMVDAAIGVFLSSMNKNKVRHRACIGRGCDQMDVEVSGLGRIDINNA